MKRQPKDSQVNKRQLVIRRRVVRAGEEDPPETRTCALPECSAVFLPYSSKQIYHSVKCTQRAYAKKTREYHRLYNLKWRADLKKNRPALAEKYARHDARRTRARRYANGSTPRPERYRYR